MDFSMEFEGKWTEAPRIIAGKWKITNFNIWSVEFAALVMNFDDTLISFNVQSIWIFALILNRKMVNLSTFSGIYAGLYAIIWPMTWFNIDFFSLKNWVHCDFSSVALAHLNWHTARRVNSWTWWTFEEIRGHNFVHCRTSISWFVMAIGQPPGHWLLLEFYILLRLYAKHYFVYAS